MQQTTELNIIAIDDHQQMEPPRSLSRSRNSHVNRRKKEEKLKFPTTAITKKLALNIHIHVYKLPTSAIKIYFYL